MISTARTGALCAAWLGAMLADREPPDTCLGALSALGSSDWLSVIGWLRSHDVDTLDLRLPRSGDPRGYRSPGPQAVLPAAVVGLCRGGDLLGWLTPDDRVAWAVHEADGTSQPSPRDPAEADRLLRAAILAAEGALASMANGTDAEARTRLAMEAQKWAAAPLLPPRSALAARAVPIWLAAVLAPEAGVSLAQQHARAQVLRDLEPVARTAVEVAYSTVPMPH